MLGGPSFLPRGTSFHRNVKEGNYVRIDLVGYCGPDRRLAHRENHERRRLWSDHGYHRGHPGGAPGRFRYVAPGFCRFWRPYLYHHRRGYWGGDPYFAASPGHSWSSSTSLTLAGSSNRKRIRANQRTCSSRSRFVVRLVLTWTPGG